MQNKEIAVLQGSIILNTAMEGSHINMLYRLHGAQATNQMLDRGVIDDDSATVSAQTANELERLIRTGLSLAEAIYQMCCDGWVKRIYESVEHREL